MKMVIDGTILKLNCDIVFAKILVLML